MRALSGAKRTVTLIVVAQLSVMFITAAVCLLLDEVAAYSSLLGGFVALAPGVYAALRLLRRSRADGSGLAPVLLGELGKFVLSISLFVVVFSFIRPLNVLSFFGTFMALQLVYVVVPVIEAKRLRAWPTHK